MHTPSDYGEALRVDSRSDGPAVIVRAVGEVDMDTAPMLIKQLALAADHVRPPAPVVADLRDIRFFGSSGIAALLRVREMCRERRTELRILPSRRMIRPLIITGVDTMLALRATLTAALQPVTGTAMP